MKLYRLTAKLLSPLIIQRDRQSHAPQGLEYLPGSSLRGALAAKWLRQGRSPDDELFRDLFLDNPVSFPTLLPTPDPGVIPRVLPMTAISCKREPGFLVQGKHGVRDSLAVTAGNRLRGEKGNERLWVCDHHRDGRHCCQDMKPFSGVWNGDPVNPKKCEAEMIYKRHTGIDRQTGTVASGIFYTTQAMADSRRDADSSVFHEQMLCGGISLDQKQHHYFQELMGDGFLFAGADRSRGFGELKMSLSETPWPDFDLPTWSDGFRKRFQEVMTQDVPAEYDGLFFSVKLESPAILLDRYLRPTVEIVFSFEGVEPVLKVARAQTVRGWQASWGLPKPDDPALAPGSVFLFHYRGDDREGLAIFLREQVITGIGFRQGEGFGRFSVCEPMHLLEVI